MIDWLLQSAAEHPDLARGVPSPGVFSSAELLRLEQFRFDKRRREWLLGRWTAKQLLRSHLRDQYAFDAPLDALLVGREPGGAPVAILDSQQALNAGWPMDAVETLPLIGAAGEQPAGPALTVVGVRLPVSLSISHSNGAAFCALLRTNGATAHLQLGADIERIDTRSQQFRTTFLTATENAWISSATADLADMLVTATWSVKEAVLKALQLGLTVDTRRVTALCRFDGDLTQWTPVQIECDSLLIPRRNVNDGVTTPVAHQLTGWWRTADAYVLSMAALEMAVPR
ncbi:MAG: 4'-phosphopantetheinyl transferase superfamily protein [Anaerolineae bacterium]|nr:4'-phosphopantetheinyl transferase superfamily protein [Anaerolineae bacterium]MCB9129587.1 4'-phosphopantetheinyl transferase superfamily protein [Anaerolineales bacterium]MCB0234125.1 4'-phosphopantetheinyl transferase superfamily protein [Anaerolineae bacterium]MCB0246270.1 4'-phosphopantetheinyl transferase superfamily protein [Anaerolineae bacterium]MCB0249756.1 4'-phosphopantetheinyl transferase superfamily protein [Anaerolineae bacterium]